MYLEFLHQQLPDLLDIVLLQQFINSWFQHDEAPPHFSSRVGNFLNKNILGD